MRAIETAISVNTDGSATIELHVPREVSAGIHRAVVIVEEQAAESSQQLDAPPALLPLAFPGWPLDCSFRREDLYGDDGR